MLGSLQRRRLRVRAHALDVEVARGDVEPARDPVRIEEAARQGSPRREELVGGTQRPQRDACLVEVDLHARREQHVVRVVRVEQADGVGLTPGDRLAADAHEERTLRHVDVGFVDARAPAVELAAVAAATCVVQRLRDRMALRVKGSLGARVLRQVEVLRIALRPDVVDAVVETPDRETSAEVGEEAAPARELAEVDLQLRVVEVAPLLHVAGVDRGLRVVLRLLGRDRELAVHLAAELDRVVLAEADRQRGARRRSQPCECDRRDPARRDETRPPRASPSGSSNHPGLPPR